MSVRLKISVKVQDRLLREDGPIQGARVALWWIQEPSGEPFFRRERITDSQGLAVFLVPPGKYLAQVNAQEYTAVIEDAIGNEASDLVIDTAMGTDQFPVFANMTRDE